MGASHNHTGDSTLAAPDFHAIVFGADYCTKMTVLVGELTAEGTFAQRSSLCCECRSPVFVKPWKFVCVLVLLSTTDTSGIKRHTVCTLPADLRHRAVE